MATVHAINGSELVGARAAALIYESQASALEAAARGLEYDRDAVTTTGEVAERLRASATEIRDCIR